MNTPVKEFVTAGDLTQYLQSHRQKVCNLTTATYLDVTHIY